MTEILYGIKLFTYIVVQSQGSVTRFFDQETISFRYQPPRGPLFIICSITVEFYHNLQAFAICMLCCISDLILFLFRLGLDSKMLAKILNMSTGRCWSSDTYNPHPGVFEGVPSSNNYQGGFGSQLMAKVDTTKVSLFSIYCLSPFTWFPGLLDDIKFHLSIKFQTVHIFS